MTPVEISQIRLISQKIALSDIKSAGELVRWMGAIQAQDYTMSKWAVASRLKYPEAINIQTAMDKGEIIRIHVLRPTWHLISSDDIYWMLSLSAPKIKSSQKSRHRELELTDALIKRAESILEKNLSGGKNLTREEIENEFNKNNIRTDENRLSHILVRAELNGIVCSGPVKGNKLTYSMLHERVPQKNELLRDEALAKLATVYFKSRCPATLEDFIWWSNLSLTDARNALEFIKAGLISETTGAAKYWFPDSFASNAITGSQVHLLAAYDEFLISYRDRSCSLAGINNKKTISDNGIFYPIVVINGQVAGLWKRTIKKDKVLVSLNFFKSQQKKIIKLISNKVESFGKFLNKTAELDIK
jgi:hypothetical protein